MGDLFNIERLRLQYGNDNNDNKRLIDKEEEEEEEPTYSPGEQKIRNFHLARQRQQRLQRNQGRSLTEKRDIHQDSVKKRISHSEEEEAFYTKIRQMKETEKKLSSTQRLLDTTSNRNNIVFEGWARCFFQGRKDTSASQLTRTKKISHTPYVDNYLLLQITLSSSSSDLLLNIYADVKDSEQSILLVNPPIELKHFYAATIPTSNCGASLFLKDDDRYFHRFMFRFEFCNQKTLQKERHVEQLLQFGSAIRKRGTRIHSSAALVRHVLKHSSNKHEGGTMSYPSRVKEDETLLLFKAYRETVHELCSDSSNQAQGFITAVNQCLVEDEDVYTSSHGHRSWGPAYDDESASTRKGRNTDVLDFQDLEF